MIDILFYLAAFIVALGVLIVVHEFGHYWVARRMGVKVLRFSIGFGKPLWRRKAGRDGTEFVVAALPLGGYVKMLDETEGAVPKGEAHRAFNRQPVWKRIPIVVAGPMFNFLFAILAYWAVYLVGIDGIRPIVGKVAEGSVAEQGGFRAGDEVVGIDGHPVQSWGQRRLYLFQRALDHAVVNVDVKDAQGEPRTRRLDLSGIQASEIDSALLERGVGLYGYLPQILPVVGGLEDGPAKRAGIEVGDRIVRIAGQPVSAWEDIAALIGPRGGQTVPIEVERGGQRLTFEVTPDSVAQGDRHIGRVNIRPKIADIPPELRVRVRFGALDALGESLHNTWAMTALTFRMLYRMVTLEVSSKNISGPITIAQYAGYSAKTGAVQFLMFLAVISISLGVLNLLPIPVLDGGHLLYYVIEAVKGSPLSERVMLFGQQVGIALLAGLMLLAFYNDLSRLFN
ncbi:MAG: RIP metalloprotease RseP [Sulfurifustaceae bacterium]